jgi:hypothetical protein
MEKKSEGEGWGEGVKRFLLGLFICHLRVWRTVMEWPDLCVCIDWIENMQYAIDFLCFFFLLFFFSLLLFYFYMP